MRYDTLIFQMDYRVYIELQCGIKSGCHVKYQMHLYLTTAITEGETARLTAVTPRRKTFVSKLSTLFC